MARPQLIFFVRFFLISSINHAALNGLLHQVKHHLAHRKDINKEGDKCNWSANMKDPQEKLTRLIGTRWPDLKEEVDVICFQEVWDLYSALPLIAALKVKGRFSDFIFNAQRCTMEDNLVVFGCKCALKFLLQVLQISWSITLLCTDKLTMAFRAT